MRKITMELESIEEAVACMKGLDLFLGVDEIWQTIFRPNFKHGYGDKLLDSDVAYEIIEALSDRYRELVKDGSV